MQKKKLYSYDQVISATYYDVINMMGEDGINAKLTPYDLLAVMAAPCTRLDYDNTDRSKRKPLMDYVHKFILSNPRITNLVYQKLLEELNKSFLPSLSVETQAELLKSFHLVMGIDADGYVIFNKKCYDVYKGNLDRGVATRIEYAPIKGKDCSSELPDKVIYETYYVQNTDGLYHLDLNLSVTDWVDILRGASVKAMQLIGAFTQLDDFCATIIEIEEKFGINKDSINGITVGLGNRAKRIMGIEVIGTDNTTSSCWTLPFNNGRNVKGRGFVWQLRPEVYEAYHILTNRKQ